jgi:hypothetical protein
VMTKVRNALAEKADAQNKKIFEYIALVGKYNTRTRDKNFPKAEREANKILQTVFKDVLLEKITPTEGSKKLISELKDLLSR